MVAYPFAIVTLIIVIIYVCAWIAQKCFIHNSLFLSPMFEKPLLDLNNYDQTVELGVTV
jgi:hypothetical protein